MTAVALRRMPGSAALPSRTSPPLTAPLPPAAAPLAAGLPGPWCLVADGPSHCRRCCCCCCCCLPELHPWPSSAIPTSPAAPQPAIPPSSHCSPPACCRKKGEGEPCRCPPHHPAPVSPPPAAPAATPAGASCTTRSLSWSAPASAAARAWKSLVSGAVWVLRRRASSRGPGAVHDLPRGVKWWWWWGPTAPGSKGRGGLALDQVRTCPGGGVRDSCLPLGRCSRHSTHQLTTVVTCITATNPPSSAPPAARPEHQGGAGRTPPRPACR